MTSYIRDTFRKVTKNSNLACEHAGFYLLGGAGGKLPPQNVNLPPQTFS